MKKNKLENKITTKLSNDQWACLLNLVSLGMYTERWIDSFYLGSNQDIEIDNYKKMYHSFRLKCELDDILKNFPASQIATTYLDFYKPGINALSSVIANANEAFDKMELEAERHEWYQLQVKQYLQHPTLNPIKTLLFLKSILLITPFGCWFLDRFVPVNQFN